MTNIIQIKDFLKKEAFICDIKNGQTVVITRDFEENFTKVAGVLYQKLDGHIKIINIRYTSRNEADGYFIDNLKDVKYFFEDYLKIKLDIIIKRK